jgi:hypothetical protein
MTLQISNKGKWFLLNSYGSYIPGWEKVHNDTKLRYILLDDGLHYVGLHILSCFGACTSS